MVTLKNIKYLDHNFQHSERPSDEYKQALQQFLEETATGQFQSRISSRILDLLEKLYPHVVIDNNDLPNIVNEAYATAADKL